MSYINKLCELHKRTLIVRNEDQIKVSLVYLKILFMVLIGALLFVIAGIFYAINQKEQVLYFLFAIIGLSFLLIYTTLKYVRIARPLRKR